MQYQMRAYLYIKAMFEFVNDWCDWNDILSATEKTFFKTGKHAVVETGSSRIVIIGSDFVVKWDYDKECVSEIGGCEDEFKKYKETLSTGYAYLLAPVFRFTYRERYFYVMPKIKHIGRREHDNKTIDEFTTIYEREWLQKNIGDLHSWNWGLENNKPIIIDYACPPSKDTSDYNTSW